jgi:hypothetical protein
MVNLENDIVERIYHDFPPQDAERAVKLLDACFKGPEPARVARCIVVAAMGSLESLTRLIEMAVYDYRDAIMAGEYKPSGERIRDLRVTFLIDSPEKMWISGIAGTMYGRGFHLKALETRTLPVDPCESNPVRFDGVATFVGRLGEIQVEKRNKQWMIHTELNDFLLNGLKSPHEDLTYFQESLSSFLAAIQKPNPNRRKR